MTTTKKAAAKAATKPASAPTPTKRDPLPLLRTWHRAQQQLDVIDAQTGPDANLPARDVERLQAERARLAAAQADVEKALV